MVLFLYRVSVDCAVSRLSAPSCRSATKTSCGDGEAARHDARNRAPLHAAAAFAVNLTRQATDKGGKRAAAAQQPQPLLAAEAPRLQRRQFKQTRRQLQCQLRRRVQVMRARGSASEDGASGYSVQHKTHDVTALQNG